MCKTCGQCYYFKDNRCLKGKRIQTFSVLSACDEYLCIQIDYTYRTSITAPNLLSFSKSQIVSNFNELL